MWTSTWCILPFLLTVSHAQQHKRQVESIVIGDPTVVCEADMVHVYVKTRDTFVGNMYVRSHFMDSRCRSNFQNNQQNGAYLSVKLGDCGMIRSEQANPLGVNYKLDVVVSSHPIFETRNDQAYSVGCFYKSEQIPVNSKLQISDNIFLNPAETIANGVVENKCDYSIRVESVSGALVRFTEIGKPIVHRWACEDKHLGILVKDCVAQSESIFSTPVIDNRGCPVSDFFDKLIYDNELTMAFVQIEAFKFPDVDTIRFSCNISFCEKHNGGCVGVTPPNCPHVRPSEYMPHSVIDANMDPTRIYATMENRNPVTQSPWFLVQPSKKQTITTATYAPIIFGSMRRQKDYVKNDGPDYVEVLPARQLPIITPVNSQQNLRLPHGSTTSPSLLLLKRNQTSSPVFHHMSNERNVRARREDTTLSVKAETLFVADPQISSNEFRKRSILMPNGEEDTGLCLNKKSTAAFILFITLLTIFSLGSCIYIAYDVCSARHRRLKAQITARKELATSDFACSIRSFNAMK